MRRIATLLLALCIVVPAAAERRRAAYPAAPPCAEAVIASPFLTTDVVVDESHVYFSDDTGGLFRAARNGGQVQKLLQMPGDDVIYSLAVDDAAVYFVAAPSDGFLLSIDSVSKSGGSPTTLLSGVVTPFDLVIDRDFVYWNSLGTPIGEDFASDGAIERVRKDGTQHSTLASSLSYPLAIALDGDNVLFSETGLGIGNTAAGLRSVPKSGGAVTPLLSGVPVLAITSDANKIYAGTFDIITSGASITSVDRATKTTVRLTTETGLPLFARVVGNEVYYFLIGDSTDSIRAVASTGGSSRVIREGTFATQEFVVDGCAIFYSTVDPGTLGGTIRRGPR